MPRPYNTKRHGDTRGGRISPEYRIWRGIKTRCLNPSDHSYPGYGGRGITICDRWRDSFEDFLADVGRRPSPKHSIDRINNDGSYEPGNVRWATPTEQQLNKMNNAVLTLNGVTRCQSEWSALTGVSQVTISARLRRGWIVEQALTPLPSPNRLWTIDGVTRRQFEWAALAGVSPQLLYQRLKRGWPIEKALIPSRRLSA